MRTPGIAEVLCAESALRMTKRSGRPMRTPGIAEVLRAENALRMTKRFLSLMSSGDFVKGGSGIKCGGLWIWSSCWRAR
jgi:hypothetical protein